MKRLFIDFEKCAKNPDCRIPCSYFYHPNNSGITYLMEVITWALVCRRCEEACCIKVCPTNALKKDETGIIRRSNFLCIRCLSCSLACPFGTIYPENIPYLLSYCDYCLSRLKENEEPLCVKECPDKKLIQYIEVKEEPEKNIFYIGNYLAVRVIPWKQPIKEE